MTWGGKMKCNVTNQTGRTIAVIVQHVWGDRTPDRLNFKWLGNNESVEFDITVGEGDSDLWSVWFMDDNGKFWYREGKRCDVKEEDFGKVVGINLGTLNFSIKTPASSPCNDVGYKSCP